MPGALRLRFLWDNGRITLQEARPVAKRAPAGDPAQAGGQQPRLGMALELRSADAAFYHRQVAAMFPDSHEVQTGDPDRPFARAPRTRPYVVELLVPVPDRAARLVLTEHRAGPAKGRKAAATPTAIVHVDEALKHDPGPAVRQGEA